MMSSWNDESHGMMCYTAQILLIFLVLEYTECTVCHKQKPWSKEHPSIEGLLRNKGMYGPAVARTH